tara:strand:+ start:74 stop:796 length:723 start_codon:yes stop_codon:yes gene_type:complete
VNFEDVGIVMSVRKHGESSGILELISKNHGRHLGLVRGYQSKNNKSILQPGSTINFNWRSRLSEHLGVITFELHTSRSLNLMKNKFAILVLQNLISHLRLLPEREKVTKIYNYTEEVLDLSRENYELIKNLILWELLYLKEIGYGIDIHECAVTKSKSNLKYVSPKSGKAVTEDIGLPYKDKLLEIPEFIYDAKYTNRDDLLKGLLLTEFFLKRDVYMPLQLKVTSFRASLYKLINSFET